MNPWTPTCSTAGDISSETTISCDMLDNDDNGFYYPVSFSQGD